MTATDTILSLRSEGIAKLPKRKRDDLTRRFLKESREGRARTDALIARARAELGRNK